MSLYRNINKRKRAGTSRPKSKSTISAKAYRNMKAGFPNSKKNKAKRKARRKRLGLPAETKMQQRDRVKESASRFVKRRTQLSKKTKKSKFFHSDW